MTASVTTLPKYGTVVRDLTTGLFTYTPNQVFLPTGISDTFTVTVSNGATTTAGLDSGVSSRCSALFVQATRNPDATSSTNIHRHGPGRQGFGRPVRRRRRRTLEALGETELLQLRADGIRDGRGPGHRTQTADEATVVRWAMELDSIVQPGRKMFLSTRLEIGAWPRDAALLMEKHLGR